MSWGTPFDWEDSDSQYWASRKAPEDHEPYTVDERLNCALCTERLRMPGHAICSYCDRVGVQAYAVTGLYRLTAMLKKYEPWAEWQANHPTTEGEAYA
jgi:hypothetical protein